MKGRVITNLAAVFMMLFCSSLGMAATRTWTGTTDSDWTKASNWGGTAPVAGDTANIPGGLTNYPIITTSVTIQTLNVNSAGTGASVTVNSGGTLNVGGGGLTVNLNGTMIVSGGTVLSANTLTDNGSVSISSGTIHMANAIGTAPTDAITIGAGATFTQSGGSVDTKDFATAAGPPVGTYNQSAGVFRMYHDFKNSGSFNATGGTVEFNANAGGGSFPSPLGTTQFFNVVMNGDPHFDNNNVSFSVAGDWTANVALDLSAKPITATFNGTGAQTIGGSAAVIFANLVVNKPTGTTVTLAQNESTKNGNVNVISGTFDVSTFTLNGAAATDTITVANGATLRIGGANSFPPNYLNHLLGATSTVEYYGTNQVVTAENYGHLILSGNGIKTMPATPLTTLGNFTMAGTASATAAAAITVNGNFTLGAGTTFGAGSFSHSVKGNFTNSGTFNAGASTFTFNGTTAQIIGGSNSSSFNSLTVNNSNGVTLSGVDITVNNTLTFTSGTITTGGNKVILPAGGNVSRSSGHVVGNLQKYFTTGAPGATFEVGSASVYAPINVSFASVSVAGNLMASTTTGDHPNIGSSNITAAKTANRFWTLTNSGISFTTSSVTFNFASADLDAGANTSNFIVGRYSSGWAYPAAGTKTSTSTQATGLTAFGDFQLGEGGPPVIKLVKSANVSGSALPGTDLGYTVSFTNSGASVAQSLVLTDPVPANTDFKVGSAAQDVGSTGLGVMVAYSNDNGISWAYTPVSGGGSAPAGYDRKVTHVRWAFSGSLSQNSPSNSGNVSFTTRIR
jgi:hypothetical protein